MLKDVGYSDVSTDITEFKHTSYDLFRTLNIHEDISGISVSILNFYWKEYSNNTIYFDKQFIFIKR